MKKIKKYIEKMLDIIYPPECGICRRKGYKGICRRCEMKLEKRMKFKRENYKKDKEKYFDEHIYFFKYQGIIRQRLLWYKFYHRSYLYQTFVKLIFNPKNNCQYLNSYDIIIPVPIHKKRRRARGYNQCELIAKEIAKKLKDVKYEQKAVKKQINKKPQSLLSRDERTENIKGAYKIEQKEKIEGKNIIVFDDIYTTGSTANEISKLLKQNGAKKICILTIAKV